MLVCPSLATAQAGEPQALSADMDIPCPMGNLFGETAGESILCGQIQVPENWDAPDGTTITIAYAVLKSQGLAPFTDPIIYFAGGPGGSALATTAQSVQFFAGPRKMRDIILWDQRGTTYSNLLHCPISVRQPDAERMAALDEEYAPLTFNIHSDPEHIYTYYSESVSASGIDKCLPYFEEKGIDLSQYNTRNTVLDAIALMRHLGYPAYNLYGASYGTKIAQEILDYYAKDSSSDLPPIRSMVVDGVDPRNMEWLENGYIQSYLTLRVFADCEADESCGAAYPDIRQRLIDLLANMEEAPLTTDDGAEITLDEFIGVLRTGNTNVALRALLPRMVDELTRGQTAAYAVAQAAAAGEIFLPQPPAEAEAATPLDIPASISEPVTSISSDVFLTEIQLTVIAAALAESDSRPALYANILREYVDGLSSGAVVSSLLGGMSTDPTAQTRDKLIELGARLGLPGLVGALSGLASTFTDEEVAQTIAIITSEEFVNRLITFESLTNNVVVCNDHAANLSNERAFEVYQSYEAPQLLLGNVGWVGVYQTKCEALGLSGAAYAPPPAAVVSDIPTLVINGEIDAATPAEWGRLASEGLTNATLVTLPGTPHVPGLSRNCGRALIDSFFASPEGDISMACVEALRVPFVAPDDLLPELPE
ncbi:MAG: alpha/beta hydrolase [Caldilineaceae bacterium]